MADALLLSTFVPAILMNIAYGGELIFILTPDGREVVGAEWGQRGTDGGISYTDLSPNARAAVSKGGQILGVVGRSELLGARMQWILWEKRGWHTEDEVAALMEVINTTMNEWWANWLEFIQALTNYIAGVETATIRAAIDQST